MSTTLSRRGFLRELGCIGGSLPAAGWLRAAWAAAAPCAPLAGKTITWIVPNAPGGGYDTYSRMVAPPFEQTLSAKVMIRNMPEAGGLVGTQAILHAAPDGRTIGMINASGLLAAALAGEKRAPNPASAFTLLGCVARAYHVWVTRRDSSLRTMEDVFAENRTRPVVFGTREVGSSSFVDAALTAHVLGLHIDIVGGYTGSNDTVLAAMRREVDIVTHTLEAVVDHIENGDLRPLLQIGVSRRFAHPVLADVPLLGGTEGVAARRARQTGRPVEAVLDDVDALVRLIGAGRLVAGPPGIPPDLSACMGSALLEALQGADFQRRARDAGLSLDIASGEEAYEALQAVSRKFDRFAPVIRTAIRKVRE